MDVNMGVLVNIKVSFIINKFIMNIELIADDFLGA